MVHRITDFDFSRIREEDLKIDELLASHYPYEHGLVTYIEHARSMPAFSLNDVLKNEENPIKIEGYERFSRLLFDSCSKLAIRFNHFGYVSAHLFLSPKGALSFPMHTDLDDVVIYMVEGKKEFVTDNETFVMEAGQSLYIPRGASHMAVNVEESIMISFGLELFIEQKLSP